jgi:hypothetical protein
MLPVPVQTTPASTIYADLIAHAATSTLNLADQAEALRAIAERLELAPFARTAVHMSLAQAWRAFPTAAHSLTALCDSQKDQPLA